jgi:drug/metabolite transporter (DMT)-like permease
MAALASAAGKIATDGTVVTALLKHIKPLIISITSADVVFGYTIDEATQTAFRVVAFAMIFVFNAIMMNAFVKAMNFASSVTAVVINTASNFFCTAVLGMLIFGEPLPLLWWAGAALILAGVAIIAISGSSAVPQSPSKTTSSSDKSSTSSSSTKKRKAE